MLTEDQLRNAELSELDSYMNILHKLQEGVNELLHGYSRAIALCNDQRVILINEKYKDFIGKRCIINIKYNYCGAKTLDCYLQAFSRRYCDDITLTYNTVKKDGSMSKVVKSTFIPFGQIESIKLYEQ